MKWDVILKKIPGWLVTFLVLLGAGIIVERIYWSKKPIILFGAYFGPPPAASDEQVRQLRADNQALRERFVDKRAQNASPKPASSESGSLVQEISSLRVELKKCQGAGSTLSCKLAVTNTGPAQMFFIMPYDTRLITSDGVEYKTNRQRLGAAVNEYQTGEAGERLSRDVPVEATVSFNDVRMNFTTASLLDIDFGGESHAEFRNVPILR